MPGKDRRRLGCERKCEHARAEEFTGSVPCGYGVRVGPLEKEIAEMLKGRGETVSVHADPETARVAFAALTEAERARRYEQLHEAVHRLARAIDELQQRS